MMSSRADRSSPAKSRFGLVAVLAVIGLAFAAGVGLPHVMQQPAAYEPPPAETGAHAVALAGATAATQTVGDLQVRFAVPAQPLKAMAEHPLTVELQAGGRPVTDASVSVNLAMVGMYMGENRPVLHHQGQGRYVGTGIFPVCSSGKGDWVASVAVNRDGQTSTARFGLLVGR